MSLRQRARNIYDTRGGIALLYASLRYGYDTTIVSLSPPEQYNGVQLELEGIATRPKISIRRGNFEDGTLRLIEKHLPRATPVIEFGAGIGIISCYLSNHTAENVIAVEPNESVIDKIRRHAELNGCDITVINAAYSSSGESLELALEDEYWASSTTFTSEKDTVSVPGISLKDIVESNELSKFSLVTNAEGAEYDLLQNEQEILASSCEGMIIGFHDDPSGEVSKEEIVSAVESIGFEHVNTDGKDKYYFKNLRLDQ